MIKGQPVHTEIITRESMRRMAYRFAMYVHEAESETATVPTRELEVASAILTTPAWFSANELRLAADAMDILDYHTADGWTLRQRLDDFWRHGPVIRNAGSFAAYLHNLPNGGVQ